MSRVLLDSVSTADIRNGAVSQDKLGIGAVGTAELATAAVTQDKLGFRAVGNPELANDAVTGDKIAANSVSGSKLSNYFTITGSELLTQPEFNVAGFNQIIAEADLTQNVTIDPATFEPIVLVTVRPSQPPADGSGNDPVEYAGDISWEVVTTNVPPQPLGGGTSSPRDIDYTLQFRLETQPQPPQSDGSPAPGDLAPAGSQVTVNYRVVFVKYTP